MIKSRVKPVLFSSGPTLLPNVAGGGGKLGLGIKSRLTSSAATNVAFEPLVEENVTRVPLTV